jgi:hypothetical protein
LAHLKCHPFVFSYPFTIPNCSVIKIKMYCILQMSDDILEVCRELDDLMIQTLDLMEEQIKCKLKLQETMKSSCLNLAKARYIMGHNSVSCLQLPTEESAEIAALRTVASSVETKKNLEHMVFELHTVNSEQISSGGQEEKSSTRRRTGKDESESIGKEDLNCELFDGECKQKCSSLNLDENRCKNRINECIYINKNGEIGLGRCVRLVCFEEPLLLLLLLNFILFLYYLLFFEKCNTRIPLNNKSCLINDDLNEKANPYLCFYTEIGTEKEGSCVSSCQNDLFEVYNVFFYIFFFVFEDCVLSYLKW